MTYKDRIVRGLFVLIVGFIPLMYFTSQTSVGEHQEISLLSKNNPHKADKWIVVTTINMPTQDVRKLAKQPGWKLVVVGDKKTPKEWSLPNVVFLDLKTQSALGYRILKYLPIGKYTRKAVGYLFAIQHGAKCIYETDDDNSPTHGLSGFQCDDVEGVSLMVSSSNITENPYAHFGQSTIWPRGYPLDRVGLPVDYKYQVCNKPTPTILQGVVNGDPDVDAVFRLTRRQPPMAFTLTFDSAAPPLILPPGTFAPFNSQNTFFLFRSLWAMILPISVTDRATDIYRSYWAQRLLWLVGDTLAFLPPNAVQVRNLHSLLKDAQEEYEMYQQMPRFVTVLNEWRCDKHDGTLFNCINQLSKHLVEKGFWKELDADLVTAWLEDLKSVGYTSPLIVDKPHTHYCKPEKDISGKISFFPFEQTTSMPHTSELHVPAGSTNNHLVYNAVGEMCDSTQQMQWNHVLLNTRKNTNLLLVVSVSTEAQAKMPLLVAHHQLYYANVIYCFPEKVRGDFINTEFIKKWRVSIIWTSHEVDAVACLTAASKMQYGVRGFLYITDSAFLNADDVLFFEKLESPMWLYKNPKQQPTGITLLNDALKRVGLLSTQNAQQKERLTTCLSQIGKEVEASNAGEAGSETSLLFIPQKLVNPFWQLRNILTSKLDPFLAPILQCQLTKTRNRNASAHHSLRSNITFGKSLCS